MTHDPTFGLYVALALALLVLLPIAGMTAWAVRRMGGW